MCVPERIFEFLCYIKIPEHIPENSMEVRSTQLTCYAIIVQIYVALSALAVNYICNHDPIE